MLLRGQRCMEWKKHAPIDRKGRRKFFHICLIQWDMSTFSKFTICYVSSQDIRTFSLKIHLKSIAPRWVPKEKRQNSSAIFPTYRFHEAITISKTIAPTWQPKIKDENVALSIHSMKKDIPCSFHVHFL